jgi:hypothetical protein
MELHAIGIDLGKTLFHLVGVDACGNVVVRKRCSRTQFTEVHREPASPANRHGSQRFVECSIEPNRLPG